MASPPVRVGSREIAVEQSPLRTTFVRSHSPFALSWPDDGALEIKYHRVVRLFAWILCVLGWPVLLLGLLGLIGLLVQPEAANFVAVALLLLWGGVMGLMGVWLLGPRCRFDASDGQLTIRHFWRTRRRPLAEIVAVQMIDAGWFGTKIPSAPGGAAPVRFSSYQLNLVLDDPSEPRLFVAYNHDFTDMARKAKVLADFLGVPLLAAPKVHELVQAYGEQDAPSPAGVAGVRRFRGNDALRSVRDRQLPEPYRSWIDRTQPLPAHVRLLPRSVNVFYDLSMFVLLGSMFIGMGVLIVSMFWPVLAGGDWQPILILGAGCLLLGFIPLYLLRRLCTTIGAWRDRKHGTLRQGILVGPEGILVRMELNRSYAIALDRFVNAKIEAPTSSAGTPDFVIETLDGPVAFFVHWSSAPPEHLNQCVEELRRSASPPPTTA